MPRITDDLEQVNLPNNHFGYSAARLSTLEATEYTLVQIIQDVSGSVQPYARDMEVVIKEVAQACQLSPRADNLMLRLVTFNTTLFEIHGFKPLQNCNIGDYDSILVPQGGTALFDAVDNAVLANIDYAKKLTDADYSVNGLTVIITDGEDNSSRISKGKVGETIKSVVQKESMESLITILVGVGLNRPDVSVYLKDFKDLAGLTEYLDAGAVNKKTLAKLAQFISKSISSQSQSLAQSLTF